MTTATPPPKPTETTRKLFPKTSWTQPKNWADWDFLDMVNCPDYGKINAQAPKVDRACPHCGRVEKWTAIEAAAFASLACAFCCDEQNKHGNPERTVTLVKDRLEKTIPPLYRETDRARLEKETTAEQVAEALQWAPGSQAKSLAFVGDTRAGKTRTLCLLLDKLVRDRVKVRAFFHGSFYDELLEVIRSDRNFRKWKNDIINEELVAIDDLFAEKLTERGESSLFDILDARICHKRPTFITTQITKKEGLGRFASVKRAEAFFARLNEFFKLIPCGKPKTENARP